MVVGCLLFVVCCLLVVGCCWSLVIARQETGFLGQFWPGNRALGKKPGFLVLGAVAIALRQIQRKNNKDLVSVFSIHQ
ncbi:MAG: hypothetical protein F6K47_04760 [Symploca sp. SIO2E6]|nr:hypothetical protein [Symploca sp. SIO2E6]